MESILINTIFILKDDFMRKMQEVENFVDKTLLQVITNELAKQAQGIIKKREQFIGELNSYVLEAGKKVSNGNEDFKIII